MKNSALETTSEVKIVETVKIDKQTDKQDGGFSIEKLPILLQNLVASFDKKYQEMILLSSITVVSSVLPNVFAKYLGLKVYPNLYLYVIGKAGSGKGNLVWTKKLLATIEQGRLEDKSSTKKTTPLSALLELEDSKIPTKIFIPANSTSAGFTELFGKRNGVGLIFETEGDTLANTFKSDYGNYSDMLRKAFHHETISQYRKTDSAYTEIAEPKLSVVISSTPNQLKRIITNAENGLFSRFMYLYTEPTDEFLDVFSKKENGRNDLLSSTAKDLALLYWKLLDLEGIEFTLTAEQQIEFLAFFNRTKSQLVNLFHEDLEGTVNRTAIITLRIAMILAILRNAETTFGETVVCGDDDFRTAICLAEKLLYNANETLKILPTQLEDSLSTNKLLFFQALPDAFTKAEALVISSNFGMKERTVDRFLKTACFEKVSHGNYRKTE